MIILRRCLGWDGGHRYWKFVGVRRDTRPFGIIVSDGICKACAKRMAARLAEHRQRKAGGK